MSNFYLLEDGISAILLEDDISVLLTEDDGTVVVWPRNIPAAIRERVESIPELIDRLPGGWWFGTPDEDADDNMPYGVLTLIARRPFYDTCGLAGYTHVYQVSLVGDDFDELDSIANVWHATYFSPGMVPLVAQLEIMRSLYNGDISADIGDPVPSPFAANTVVVRWTLEIVTGSLRS